MMFSRIKNFVQGNSLATGASLYIMMRWFDRIVGLVSTVFLARLLHPEDFGIIALTTTIIGLGAAVLDIGINITIVQKSRLTKEDIDTAWTLRVLQECTLAVAIAVSSPFLAKHFDDHRILSVLIALAVAQAIQSFQSLGPTLLQRDMKFAREVAFFMSKRLISFIVTLVLAVLIGNYWALVFGTMTGSIVGVAISYLVHPSRPSFCLKNWRHFTGSSFWLMLRSIAGYSGEQTDKLVMGRRDSVSVLGAYSIADQFAQLPSSELIAPMARALLPAYSKIKNDIFSLKNLYLKALGIQTTIALPAGVGVALLSEEIILVFLGDSWSEAVSFLVVLALTYSLYAFSNSSSYLLLAKAKFKLAAAIQFVPLVSLLLMVLVFFPDLSGVGIAIARFLSSAILVFLYVLCGILILGKDIIIPAISVVFRPVISVFLMACSVKWFGVIFSDLPYFILLFVKPIVGAVVYIIVILGMWNFQGRPEGAEEFFLNIFRKFRRFGKSV